MHQARSSCPDKSRAETPWARQLISIAAIALLVASPAHGATGDTTLISRSRSASTGAQTSRDAVVSPDGRYVLFLSSAPNLVPDDTNLTYDVFVVDRVNGSIVRVELPRICDFLLYRQVLDAAFSETGRYVAIGYDDFCLEGETNVGSIIRFDQQTGSLTAIPRLTHESIVPAELSISADGRYLASSMQSVEEGEYFLAILHDFVAGMTVEFGIGADGRRAAISHVSISADGRFVAFQSESANLVGGDTNGTSDAFLYTRSTGQISRISKSTAGVQGNAASYAPVISADGRFVAFSSDASNLVAVDTNGKSDVFVRDRNQSSTSLVSVNNGGGQGNGISNQAAVSANGRYVAFHSFASNLVASDTNEKADVFVRDRQTNTTVRVSRGDNGAQGNGASSEPSISANGRFVAFGSFASNFVAGDRNLLEDTFIVDRQSQSIVLLSKADPPVAGMAVNDVATSADGNYVAFSSSTPNLIAGDTNKTYDVFLRDRIANTTTRISVSTEGDQADDISLQPAVSADGRYVAFISAARNLVPKDSDFGLFVRDRRANTTILVTEFGLAPRLSANGRIVAFESDAPNLVPNDTNVSVDIFVKDLTAGTIERVSLTPAGEQILGSSCCAALSADGRFVTFSAAAQNIEPGPESDDGIFIHDRLLSTTSRIDVPKSGRNLSTSFDKSAVNANGRYVAFSGISGDIYLRDRQLGRTTVVSAFPPGQGPPPESMAVNPSISADGRYIAFDTVIDGDFFSTFTGTYVHDRQTGITQRADVSSNGTPSNAGASASSLTADGRSIVFLSTSTNLTPQPLAGEREPHRSTAAFIHELSPSPEFKLAPTSLAFGNVAVSGASVARVVTVSNTGSVSVGISNIALSGDSANQFRRVNNCPAQLAAGAQCSISLTFKPTSPGTKSASLKVTPTVGKAKSVSLTGKGI